MKVVHDVMIYPNILFKVFFSVDTAAIHLPLGFFVGEIVSITTFYAASVTGPA